MTYKPEKAYKNLDFLNSPTARPIRILCEYEEPRQRFRQQGIQDTIVFFGSARARSSADAEQMVIDAQALADGPDKAKAVSRAESAVKLARYYEEARELSKRLTAWSSYRDGRAYTVSTGGGPGIMEAANRGASEVEGGRSIGLGISLPFEPGVNDYVTRELAFEFHYFFTRKYWFLYLMKAMVVFPGGFGTLDELFETLTLIQTGKVRKRMPLVLFGTEYWNSVLHMEAMADLGTISVGDLDLVHRTDSVDEAFAYLTEHLERIEAGE
jgi:uncharacterized protein (TIGR00730 family)